MIIIMTEIVREIRDVTVYTIY